MAGPRPIYRCSGPTKRSGLVGARFFSGIPRETEVLLKFKFPVSSHTIQQISRDVDTYIEKEQSITLNGHLNRKPRIMAKNTFAEFRDTNGDIVQLILTPESTDDSVFKTLEKSVPEEAVSVSGHVKLKESRSGAKEWELLVTNYQVLNEANLDAARLDKLKHSSPETLPPQFRYLQLRTPYYQNALRTRSKIANLIRNVFVDNHDFVEIETPLLFKSTPEGAREFLVPTRNPNSFYALPQSPQQYKQILMSSGFTKYFQVAKCFRDEDLRSDRQPEFTQIDLEMSFVNDSAQVGLVVEDIIYNLWKQIVKKPLYTLDGNGNLQLIESFQNFYRLPYIEALTNYGIDKPDLRSDLSFVSLETHFTPTKNPLFPVLEACVLKQALTMGKIPKSLTDSNNYSKRKPFVIPIKTEKDVKDWYKKFVEKRVFTKTSTFDEQELQAVLQLQPGDVLAFSDRASLPYENPTPLGRFRQLAITEYPDSWKRKLGADEEAPDGDYFVVTWVDDFPLFNPVAETTPDNADDLSSEYPVYDFCKFESTHHPFTMVKPEDYTKLQHDPLQAKGEHYDLVMNGVEVGGGSRRVHDPKLQTYIFKEILKIHNYNELFGHLLHALSMGCPPHAGLALGFDRLCAMIIGSDSIRDVIAFPKNQSGVDPVVESPTEVSEKTLKEYYIKAL